jgi:hypothetical protein
MGTHERLARVDRRDTTSNRKIGLTIGGALVLIGVAKLVLVGPGGAWPWLVGGGALVGIAMTAAPLLRPLSALWMRIGALLHRVANPVILHLIYWGAIAPTGLVLRLLRQDPLRLRFDDAAATYWIDRDPARATTLDKQY